MPENNRESTYVALKLRNGFGGGRFSSDGYFAATVGKDTNEEVIANYVKNQGQDCVEYKRLYLFK